ncbi:unnamed protein product [Thlaspi arvense]|uniref:RRM domain-containing protein n=1 Tax=Thlaspi arvense TaxID=13288 RepID=A0AAU9RG78_THLAR|nr:unnamed protein product [Thlaspi arvense]
MSYSKRSRYSPSLSPYEKRRGRSVSRSLSRSRSRCVSSDAENPGNSLYVTGLSHRVTERDLEDHFSKEGKVTDVHLVLDPWTREPRGFGFISMETVGDANRCIRYLDHSVLQGRVITVEKARRRRGRTPTPGKYFGLRTSRGLLATLPAGLLAALGVAVAVEATPLIVADLILLAIGGAEDHHTIGEADLTLVRDLHHLMIVTTGDATDHTHLTTGGGPGPGPDHTRLTTGDGTGQGPDPTRLTIERVTDHTRLTTEGETDPTHLKVATTEGMVQVGIEKRKPKEEKQISQAGQSIFNVSFKECKIKHLQICHPIRVLL